MRGTVRIAVTLLVLLGAARAWAGVTCPPQGAPPPVCTGTGKMSCQVNSGGLLRSYNLYVPTTYVAGQPYPLLLVLHGHYGNGPQQEMITQFDTIAEAEGFIVAYPSACQGNWQLMNMTDVKFLDDVLATTASSYTIDATRHYVSGFSEGGALATLFTCDPNNNGNIAGLAIVSTNIDKPTETFCASAAPVTYLLFHGTSDPVSHYNGGDKRHGVTSFSAPATYQFWQTQNQCNASGTVGPTTQPDELSNGKPTTDVFVGNNQCADGTTTGFFTIGTTATNGGGHNWPGSLHKVTLPVPPTGPVSLKLPASKLIWATLSAHTAP